MTTGCRFCLDNDLLDDSPVLATKHFYALMSIDLALLNAAMIIPKRHCETPFDMSAAEWADLPLALDAVKPLFARLQPDGYTIGWNIGPVAGQSIPHSHLHIIARFAGETAEGQGIRALLKSASQEKLL